MGCYAAIPALSAVADGVVARGLTAVLACIELPSVHVQPCGDDPEQLVVHALFADAAAAVVVTPTAAGLELVDVAVATDRAHVDDMRWTITDTGFRMGLSSRVPRVLSRHVGPLVDRLLGNHGLGRTDVAAWAIHPGGPRILDVCADRLGLEEDDLDASRAVLRDFGNCSSATVLLVLEEICRRGELGTGDHVVALAFGPGLTLYGALLRVVAADR
jgi:alkylresorcinol/alkylpyrone synthase